MIGICKGSAQLIADAKRRGVYTIVAGPEIEGRTADSLAADEYWNMDTSDIDALERKCREERVGAIINGISTYNIGVCIELGKRLNLPCYATSEGWNYTIDKYEFKKLCRETGVPIAKDFFVSNPPTEEELNKIKFPVVVKAVDLSANRGMSYCNTIDEIRPACDYARSLSLSTNIVVERKLEGTEYASHYAIANGKAALTDFCCMLSQPGFPGNCYSLTTTETDFLDVYLHEVHPYIVKFIEAADIKEGVCWFEMMSDKDGHLYVLEMGYRMSGDLFSIPIRQVNGFDEFKWLNDISLGIKHMEKDLPRDLESIPARVGSSYIIWSNDTSGTIARLDGLEQITEMKGVEVDNILHIGSQYEPYQYLAVILIESADYKELINTIATINSLVRIENEKGENIVIYFDDFKKIEKMNLVGRKTQ